MKVSYGRDIFIGGEITIKANKLYDTYDVTKTSFGLKNERGIHCYCLFYMCSHIKNGKWEIHHISEPHYEIY